jgi:hypothetical protein
MTQARATTCALCDCSLIAPPEAVPPSTPNPILLLCPQCKGDLQWKVNRAVIDIELHLMRRIRAQDPLGYRIRRFLTQHSLFLQAAAIFFFALTFGILIYGWVLQ